MKFNPRTHVSATEAARRLGHGRRWLFARIAAGDLEAFKHSATDVTVSLESIASYEQRTRVVPSKAAAA